MNNIFENRPSLDDLRKEGIKMLAVIVNRDEDEKTVKLLKNMRFHFILDFLAQGTAGTGIADIMGFGQSDKSLLICIAPGIHMKNALKVLEDKLKLEKPGRGIAFTIPLSGMALPVRFSIDPEKKERIQKRMEEGVDKMLESINHDLILVVINQGYSQTLIEHSRTAGANGGTVINARHVGAEEARNFLGIAFEAEKEVISILIERKGKAELIDCINNYLKENTKAQGIMLTLPVDSVTGTV